MIQRIQRTVVWLIEAKRCSEQWYCLETKTGEGFPSRGKHKGGFERDIGVSTYTSLKRGRHNVLFDQKRHHGHRIVVSYGLFE